MFSNRSQITAFLKTMDNNHIDTYFSLVQHTLQNLDKNAVNELARLMLETYNNEGTIYTFGNGGSGATASHICGDYLKGVSYGLDKRFRFICLNDNIPAMMAIANDISYDDIFIEPLRNFIGKNDLIIGISGSGNSKNVVKAMEYAKEKGVKTVALCGFNGGRIKEIADLSVHAEVMDMEVTEDIHMIIFHAVKQAIMKQLGHNFNMGATYQARIK